jgi:hypothetical protein
VVIGDDGWPLRASVEAAWRGVIAGERTRESVHDWSVPWVEGDAAHGRPRDLMVSSGLQYLHGLDMTANPETPGSIGHGGQGNYVLSVDEIAARLDHWLVMCREYDDDPEGFVRRARERARQSKLIVRVSDVVGGLDREAARGGIAVSPYRQPAPTTIARASPSGRAATLG